MRINQLLLLLLAVAVSPPSSRDFVAIAFGTMTAFAIFADSGSSNYILAQGGQGVSRRAFGIAIRTHLGLGAGGLLLAMLLLISRSQATVSPLLWVTLLAAGVSQILDSLLRVTRAPMLLAGRDGHYALPELTLGCAKLVVLGAVYLSGSLVPLLLLPILSLAAVLVTHRVVISGLATTDSSAPLLGRILRFGAAGAASACYSQMPVILAAIYLSLPEAAMLSVAYRVVQPLEVVPMSVSTQLLPRVRTHVRRPSRWWAAFCAYGATAALAVVAFGDVLAASLGISEWSTTILAIVAGSLVVKSGNYALASILMGLGGVSRRLLLTACVGLFSVLGLTLAGLAATSAHMAAVSLASELLLCLGLFVLIRREGRRGQDPDLVG
ncbi:MAG: hypothetical protein IPL43_10275 [Micropruina sp.]|nr:hypothetical protein [Micropruina sp.]